MEKTIPQIFGTGATRLVNGAAAPSSGLFIPDSVLIARGLDSPATATAEGHVVALLLEVEAALTRASYDADLDQSLFAERGYPNYVFRGQNQEAWGVKQIQINITKPDTDSGIDPNNY